MNFKKYGVVAVLTLLMAFTIWGMVQAQVDNVILMVGDGMGIDQMSIARYCNGQELNMDKLESTGFMTTHSANSYVTDSAAAGTALATSYKTNNGWISMLPNGFKPQTLLEAAQRQGKETGLVSTTRLTHATPATFVSHIKDRDKENEIAKQILNHKVDVLLGGGKRHFLPESEDGARTDGVNLLAKAEDMGYEVVDNRYELRNKTKDAGKTLGY
ncbi:alkaline phosphatase [Halanaerobaculum tunisiense]